MRHIMIRSMLALIWLAAAIYSGMSGRIEMCLLYVIMSGAFAYSAYRVWKSGKDEKGGK